MSETIRVAATSDFHYTKHCQGRLKDLFIHATHNADVLCICGDLTDYGLPEEAAILCEDLKKHLSIPCVAVLGNHDFESGKVGEVVDVFDSAGVHMLDGDSFEFEGVHIAGVCGFGGGFDSRMLNSWGEPLIKSFVQEAVDHSLRLEKALSRGGESRRKVAITHYAPIRGTVEGENSGDLPVPRLDATGGADQPAVGEGGVSWACARGLAGGKDLGGDSCL